MFDVVENMCLDIFAVKCLRTAREITFKLGNK